MQQCIPLFIILESQLSLLTSGDFSDGGRSLGCSLGNCSFAENAFKTEPGQKVVILKCFLVSMPALQYHIILQSCKSPKRYLPQETQGTDKGLVGPLIRNVLARDLFHCLSCFEGQQGSSSCIMVLTLGSGWSARSRSWVMRRFQPSGLKTRLFCSGRYYLVYSLFEGMAATGRNMLLLLQGARKFLPSHFSVRLTSHALVALCFRQRDCKLQNPGKVGC